jgi:hypothetical protein
MRERSWFKVIQKIFRVSQKSTCDLCHFATWYKIERQVLLPIKYKFNSDTCQFDLIIYKTNEYTYPHCIAYLFENIED